jgi:hypothetical protein
VAVFGGANLMKLNFKLNLQLAVSKKIDFELQLILKPTVFGGVKVSNRYATDTKFADLLICYFTIESTQRN